MLEMMQAMLEKLIDWSRNNTSGYILNEISIKQVIYVCLSTNCDINTDFIEILLESNIDKNGFFIKTLDIISMLNHFDCKI
jgi:hypothetical protein